MRPKRPDIYHIIKDRIVFLDLYPGQKIHEAFLAEELGVSRTPVREALIRLSDDLLVQTFPQSGTYVTKIDMDYVQQIVTMRHILETNIVAKLGRKKPKIRDLFAENMFSLSIAVEKRNVLDYMKLDGAFHRMLFACAGYEMIWDSFRRSHQSRYRVLDLSMEEGLKEAYQEHDRILDYLESGNIPALSRVLSRHHDYKLARQKLLMAAYPDFFGSLGAATKATPKEIATR